MFSYQGCLGDHLGIHKHSDYFIRKNLLKYSLNFVVAEHFMAPLDVQPCTSRHFKKIISFISTNQDIVPRSITNISAHNTHAWRNIFSWFPRNFAKITALMLSHFGKLTCSETLPQTKKLVELCNLTSAENGK